MSLFCTNYDLVIIGGGISGLFLAYKLCETNLKILVLEKDSNLGGRIQTKYVNNYLYEGGAARFNENHTKKATLDYFKLSLASVNNDSMIVVNNIHSNKEMEQAWIEIKNHSKVTVSIDTYQWGIVFFRKEQQKEHFIIRI